MRYNEESHVLRVKNWQLRKRQPAARDRDVRETQTAGRRLVMAGGHSSRGRGLTRKKKTAPTKPCENLAAQIREYHG